MIVPQNSHKDAAQMIVESINPEVRKILRRNAVNSIKALRAGSAPGFFSELDQDSLRRAAEVIARIDAAEGILVKAGRVSPNRILFSV